MPGRGLCRLMWLRQIRRCGILCLRIPLTEEEMLDVHGMGAKKLEQYGGTFLEKIRSVTHGDRKTWEPDSGSGQSEGPFSMGEDNLSATAAFLAAAEEQPLTDKKRKGEKGGFSSHRRNAGTDSVCSGDNDQRILLRRLMICGTKKR